ncbi:hypothetical protein ACFVMC_17430 [Nocardia sp. NPDC127579]|uniref:hypothetical protein n=1 Tax=Nocardia sp. NPDC127579 TaxID=3345402 RepID=UPI0036260DA2
MIAALLTLAVLAIVAALLVRDRGLAGSSNVVDRDAQRLRCELSAISGRAARDN